MEELAARRVEELVARKVEEELERRKDEIEAEVLRRVEEAKHFMEEQMLQELEKKRQEQEEAQRQREVRPVEMRGETRRPIALYMHFYINSLELSQSPMGSHKQNHVITFFSGFCTPDHL